MFLESTIFLGFTNLVLNNDIDYKENETQTMITTKHQSNVFNIKTIMQKVGDFHKNLSIGSTNYHFELVILDHYY